MPTGNNDRLDTMTVLLSRCRHQVTLQAGLDRFVARECAQSVDLVVTEQQDGTRAADDDSAVFFVLGCDRYPVGVGDDLGVRLLMTAMTTVGLPDTLTYTTVEPIMPGHVIRPCLRIRTLGSTALGCTWGTP